MVNIDLVKKVEEKCKAITERVRLEEDDIFPVEMYSITLDEDNTLYADGRVVFASGVEYTQDECEKLKGIGDKALRLVHEAKKVIDLKAKTRVIKHKKGPRNLASVVVQPRLDNRTGERHSQTILFGSVVED